MTLSGYLHESGFSDDPFADTEDAQLFFATPQLAQRLDLLQHLILYSDQLLVITGAAGSGKSTLLNRLVSVTAQPWRVSVVQANMETSPSQLLASAMQGFDMPEAEHSLAEQSKQLRGASERWRNRSQVPVLVIDEAHMLPPDTLAVVVKLAAEMGNSGLRILLLGEPQLADMIGAAVGGSGESMAHLVDIPAFNASQAAEYLRHRLRCAGLDADALFPDEVASRLFKATAGLPGRLNAAARDQLADRFASVGRRPEAAQAPSERVALWRRGPVQAFALLLMAAAFTWLWLSAPDKSPPPEALALAPLPESDTGVLTSDKPLPGGELPLSSAGARPLGPAHPESRATNALPAEPVTEPVEPMVDSAAVEEAVATPLPALGTLEKPVPIVAEPEPAVEVPARAVSKPAFLDPSPTSSARQGGSQQTAALESRPAARQTLERRPADRESPDMAWLLEQQPGHYTVQLTGTHDRQAALGFVRSHSLENKAAWFRTRHKDRDWYVVVAGAYPKREQAQAAIRTLPAELKRQGPWPRTFASIQASVSQSSSRAN